MSVLSVLGSLGKGLYTTARIADAGLSVYVLGDMIWTEIDPDGRYPEHKRLMVELLEKGKEYDEKVSEYIKQAEILTNLANALIVINTTVQALEDRIEQVNKRYKIIDDQIKSFEKSYPTLRNWFDEAWIRKMFPGDAQERARKMIAKPGKSAIETAMTVGMITIGTPITAYQIKSLISEGLSWYRERRNGGLPPTRPRANAIYERPGTRSYWQRVQGVWARFKVGYPKLYATLTGSFTLLSLGANIFLIVTKAKAATAREQYLRGERDKMVAGTADMQLFLNGAKKVDDLSKLATEYKFDDDLARFIKSLTEQSLAALIAKSDPKTGTESLTPVEGQVVDLSKGIYGLLGDCNGNLGLTLEAVTTIYDGIVAIVDGAADVSADEKVALAPLRNASAESKNLVSQIEKAADGAAKKAKIEQLSKLTRDNLLNNFDQWVADLDEVITISKIQSLVAVEARNFIEDFAPELRPSALGRKAKRLKETLDTTFPGRKSFTTEADVKALLEHFVELLAPALAA
jgi:hypothetical protein